MNKTETLMSARVTAVHRDRFAITGERGEGFARLKLGAYQSAEARDYPTVGDMVDILYNPQGDSQIIATHPRRSQFLRKVAGKTYGEQAVAANFDEVFIVASLNRDFNVRRIERYAALAWQSGGTPVIILTKLDLVADAAAQIHETMQAAPGAEVYAVSAHTGEGMEGLRARLSPGKVIALLGSSGVGKSSLVNALAGEILMDVGDVREEDARGRHTTTHRQMLALPVGVHIIDTPGMRELGLWDAEEGVKAAFDDIETLAAGCRFSDCRHGTEPGCAVRQAIAEGTLEEARLKSFEKLQREAERRRKLSMIKKK